MTQLRLTLFGAFSAQTIDQFPLQFRTDKIRALFVYLILEGERPHRRSSLATLLWPEMSDSASLKNLRMSLSRLRQTIKPVLPKLDQTLFGVTRPGYISLV